MAKPNTSFLLTVDDVELIEDALRERKKSLSTQRLQIIRTKAGPKTEAAALDHLDRSMRGIQELLGSLHNQKTFYRPTTGVYVGG